MFHFPITGHIYMHTHTKHTCICMHLYIHTSMHTHTHTHTRINPLYLLLYALAVPINSLFTSLGNLRSIDPLSRTHFMLKGGHFFLYKCGRGRHSSYASILDYHILDCSTPGFKMALFCNPHGFRELIRCLVLLALLRCLITYRVCQINVYFV